MNPLQIFEIQNGVFKMAATGMKNRDIIRENINLGGFRVSRVGQIFFFNKLCQTYTQNTTLLLPANFHINIVSEKPLRISLQTTKIGGI